MGDRNKPLLCPVLRHQSSCLQVVPESHQSERELHFTAAPASNPRSCLRLHRAGPPAGSQFRCRAPGSCAHSGAPPAAQICWTLGLLTAAGRPLLRRRLRKVCAWSRALHVCLAPRVPRSRGVDGGGNPDHSPSTCSL